MNNWVNKFDVILFKEDLFNATTLSEVLLYLALNGTEDQTEVGSKELVVVSIGNFKRRFYSNNLTPMDISLKGLPIMVETFKDGICTIGRIHPSYTDIVSTYVAKKVNSMIGCDDTIFSDKVHPNLFTNQRLNIDRAEYRCSRGWFKTKMSSNDHEMKDMQIDKDLHNKLRNARFSVGVPKRFIEEFDGDIFSELRVNTETGEVEFIEYNQGGERMNAQDIDIIVKSPTAAKNFINRYRVLSDQEVREMYSINDTELKTIVKLIVAKYKLLQ